MEDKKNIVIKIKYPASGNKAASDISATKVITEWNIKRILLVLAALLSLMALLFYALKPDTQMKDVQSQTALPEKIIDKLDNSKIEINKDVVRALLTYKISNNEPVGEITLPLKLSKKNPTSVYYFVELAAMKGSTVYHEWLLDGVLVTRKKVNISNENWRTSSRQLFAYSTKTNWTVRLVDETGQLLNQIPFNVIYE